MLSVGVLSSNFLLKHLQLNRGSQLAPLSKREFSFTNLIVAHKLADISTRNVGKFISQN